MNISLRGTKQTISKRTVRTIHGYLVKTRKRVWDNVGWHRTAEKVKYINKETKNTNNIKLSEIGRLRVIRSNRNSHVSGISMKNLSAL